jgi:hypothetical protein
MQLALVPYGMDDPICQRQMIQVDTLLGTSGLGGRAANGRHFGHQKLGDRSFVCRPPSIPSDTVLASPEGTSRLRVTSIGTAPARISIRSLLSSPIRCDSPWQHGQVSLTISTINPAADASAPLRG